MHCKHFENFILSIPDHLFSITLQLILIISVDIFSILFDKKNHARTFKDQNQFQLLSRPLNQTPEIQVKILK